MSLWRTGVLFARLVRPRLIERPLWRWRYRHGIPALDPARDLADLPGGVGAILRAAREGLGMPDPARADDWLASAAAAGLDQAAVLAAADRTVRREFELLGSGVVNVGHDPDWHRDFKSGHRWEPVKFWTIDYRDLGRNSDVKVAWDLSRFHFAPWLVQAWWATKDPKYPRAFAELLTSWLDANPTGYGVNWANAMEISLRAANLTWAFAAFEGAPGMTPGLQQRLAASLRWHGRIIRGNLEYGRRLNNHYVSDLVGLLQLGILFSATAEGRRWRSFATRRLEQQIRWQVYADGVSYEQSVSYHRLVFELFATAWAWGTRAGIRWSAEYRTRLERMADYIAAYTRADGSTPLVSDADDGRLFLFRPDTVPSDHRHALAFAAALFGRGDLKAKAGSGNATADVVFSLGPEASARYAALPVTERPERSVAFRDAGLYILRGAGCHTFLDAAPLGFENDIVHGHLDTLSFELSAPGGTFFSDSGSYLYTSDVPAYREHVRTKAHNTVVIDGEDVVPLARLWHVEADLTAPVVYRWETGGAEEVWEASHRGYTRLTDPVTHRRTVAFVPAERRWLITDRIEGKGRHRAEAYFHLHPEVTLVEVVGTRAVLRRRVGTLVVTGVVPWAVEDGWVAERYGVRRRAPVLVAKAEGEVPLTLTTTILWAPNDGAETD
jgi:heparinase II/III-like protein